MKLSYKYGTHFISPLTYTVKMQIRGNNKTDGIGGTQNRRYFFFFFFLFFNIKIRKKE